MNGTFLIVEVGELTSIQTNNGDLPKRIVVIAEMTTIVRQESGVEKSQNEFMVELIGDKATNFNHKPGEWIVGLLNFYVKRGTTGAFQKINLVRYVPLS